jgi:predicted aldo/keto reductase-like oxidoreductase
MDENYQAGRAGLDAAYAKDLMIIAMEPLLGGKLATNLPKKVERLFKEANPERSAAGWALRWLWNQPEITVVLSGMNSTEQLDDNLATAADALPHTLSEQESSTLAQAVELFRDAYKIACTGCNYCMPCPQGVNIPGCFSAYNMRYVTGFMSGMKSYVIGAGMSANKKGAGAGSCIKCGACETKCPQHIAIARELETVRKKMEPFWYNPAMKVVGKFMR